MKHAVVVGAGVAGLATAWELQRHGWTVTCCEAANKPGLGCTRASLGLVYPLRPTTYPPAMVQASFRAWANFEQYIAEINSHSDALAAIVHRPLLEVAASQTEMNQLDGERRALEELGFAGTALSESKALSREPQLRKCHGAVIYHDVFQVRGAQLADALAGAVKAEGGELRLNSTVTELVIESGRCIAAQLSTGEHVGGDAFVVCTGASPIPGIADDEEFRMTPMRGQVIEASRPERWLNHMVYVADLDIIQGEQGATLIGATRELGAADRVSTVAGVASILERLEEYLFIPDDLVFERVSVGLRPRSRTGLPVIGRSPEAANLTVLGGLFRNGIIMGPILAKDLVESWGTDDWTLVAPYLQEIRLHQPSL